MWTFIAAQRVDRFDAPFLIKGMANMEIFAANVGQKLCRELHPGDRVITNNVCIHKTPALARLSTARGAMVRYLPPYSPDLRLIEHSVSKLKTHLRRCAACNLDSLRSRVHSALSQCQPSHCQSPFF